MRRLTVTTALALAMLVALLVATSAASAARGFVVRGGGFGHGVGMSQYGAYGFALEGRGYKRILGHYYRRTRVGRVRGERVRVLLQASRPGPASFSNAVRAGGKRLDPSRTYTADVARSSRIVVRTGGGARVGGFRAPLRVSGARHRVRLGGPAMNGLSDGLYRGRLELRPGLQGGMTAVNDVRLDAYVRGVIAAEMPASWHRQALRAQAVAARSYAVATGQGSPIFDHYPDTRSQVYRGVAAEHPATDRAVRRTAREVVKHRGEVAKTFFFSTSGGHTEDVENVFGSRLPYLRGVRDPHDDISPFHRWRFRLSRAEMERRLGSLVRGRLRRIRVLERGASPRIIRARVRGSAGGTVVHGSTLRSRLGTYDIPRSVRRTGARAGAEASGETATLGAAGTGAAAADASGHEPPAGAVVPQPPKG